MTGGALGTGTNSFGTRFSTQIEAIGTTNFGAIVNMRNSQKTSTSIFHETNGKDQTTPEHVTVASMSFSALLKVKIFLRMPKRSIDGIVIGTASYRFGTGVPVFGTRFHHLCKMQYQVPPLWYHGTTTLSLPSKKLENWNALKT